MKKKYLSFRSLFFYSVCIFLNSTHSFGQAISVSTNGPQTISGNSASLTSNASSNNSINSTRWTKFSVPGQTLKKVIVVGSSTAAGGGTSNGSNAFVNKLRAYYQSQGIVSDIVNLAVSGTTPFDININSVLDQGTDILLVSYPSNGYTASNNGNVMNRYQEFQNACNSRNVQMFVTGTQPRNDFNDPDRANLITMNNLLRNAFTDRFVDFLTPLLNPNGNVIKGEYYADGIHPNDAGHEVLYQLVKASNIFRNSISSSSNINSPGSANTNITGLAQGVHRFQVGVFDNGGFAASAFAVITVNGGGGNAPSANAGSPQNINLPVNQVTLSGSGSAGNGGTITFNWSQVSGPNQPPPFIATPTAASTNVSGLVQGVYVFRLTVTQNDNQSATNDVTVTVNTGGPVNKTIPGKIEAESWDAKSGPQYAIATNDAGGGQKVVGITNGSWTDYIANVTTAGTYIVNFRIATTQIHAQFQIIVGGNVLGTVNIPGSGDWNNWITVPFTSISLGAGVQTIRILSTNNENCDFNWMDFILTGQPPTANAGAPQAITLPTNQVTLSGSGAANNGGTINYAWTQIGGPNQPAAFIATPTAASTNVSGLVQGVYTFRLTVTRSGDNQTATSDVTVTVNPANSGGSSTAFGGTRRTIPGKLEAEEYDNGGQNAGYFDGTGPNIGGAFRLSEAVDLRNCPDAGGGYCVGWTTDGEWLKFSVNVTTTGSYIFTARAATPNTGKSIQFQVDGSTLGTLTVNTTGGYDNWQTSTLNTNIQLTAGDHTFRFLFNTGDAGNPNFGFDVNWFNFALAPNQSPTANAGSSQSINLPTNQVTLSGSGAANNGGTITYAWTQVSGPNQPAAFIATPTAASTNVTGLVQGTYIFRLTVTRNDNQTATSDVTVTVNPAGSNGKAIPGRLEAESFDTKVGPQYAIATTDAGGGQKVVGIINGSSMDYNVTVAQSGIYTVTFRVATTKNNTQFQIKSGANNVLATINIPNTGGWDNWLSVPVSNVPLTAGPQTIRIQSTNNENCDFNWTDWVFASPLAATANQAPAIEAPVQKGITKDLFLSVFPNPAASYFNLKVQSRSMDLVTIKILDIAGRQVQQMQVVPGQALRFGDHMVNGTYLVEVSQGSERVVTKVVKQ